MTWPPPGGSPLASLYKWNDGFSTTRRLPFEDENTPYIKTHTALKIERDLIRGFMNAPSDSACNYEAEKIIEFCGGLTLDELSKASGTPVALLNESDMFGQTRPNRGMLTSYELYEALSKPRFTSPAVAKSIYLHSQRSGPKVERFYVDHGGSGSPLIRQQTPEIAENGTDIRESDAQRRLIFIANLDRGAVLALAATASFYQAPPLRDAVYKHLAFEASVAVQIPSDGWSTFTLEFHLPFYALRRSKNPHMDSRQDHYGRPGRLRKHLDISFLSRSPGVELNNDEPYSLYQAQISCVVSGLDEETWTAVAFVDTNHDGPDDAEQLSEYLHENGQYYSDALCKGTSLLPPNAKEVIRQPRDYWLRVLEIRVRQVADEWHSTVARVVEDCREYKWNNCFPPLSDHLQLKGQGEEHCRDTAKKQAQTASGYKDWISQAIELQRRLSRCLDQNVNAWQKFIEGDAYYFYPGHATPKISDTAARSFLAINKAFNKMRSLQKDIEHLMKELREDPPRDLTLHFAHENHESAMTQERTAKDVNILTWITFYFMPITMGASIMSMQPGYFPASMTLKTTGVVFMILEAVCWLVLGFFVDKGRWSRDDLFRLVRAVNLRRERGKQKEEVEAATTE